MSKRKASKPAPAKKQPELPAQPSAALPLISLGVLALTAVLVFSGLGHFAVWDDEAMIALAAKGVLKSGDTVMTPDDHNVVAYRNGLLLRDLKDRSTPPLSAYLTAASIAVFGETAWALRLPFALLCLATVGLLLFWAAGNGPPGSANDQKARQLRVVVFAIAILGNVSLFLYSRQCRYYAAALFLSVAIVFLYLRWDGRRRGLLWMALLSVLLFLSNYLSYLALYVCIGLDYLLWRRKERFLGIGDWLILLLPQVVLCGAAATIWNPLRTGFGGYVEHNSIPEKLTLLYWQFRDLNRCEFLSGLLLLVGLGYLLTRWDKWLARGFCALGTYVLVITAVSPQTVKLTSVADVRYLVALIPLGLALGTRTILLVGGNRTWLAISLAVVAFGTNLLNGGPLLWCGTRSTLAAYVGELLEPPQDPYTAASKWVNENVHKGESIWVVPDYMTYPLMFHAPRAVYAWQLEPDNKDPQFAGLPPIHFKGRVPPDYIIACGPVVQQIRQILPNWQGVIYEEAARIDCFWKDLYRPELFWRSFTPIKNYNPALEAIYVFKLRK